MDNSYPLTSFVFFNHGQLNPLLIRQKLIDAAASGEVTFPKGTQPGSILCWLWDSPWMFLEAGGGSPDSDVLEARYAAFRTPEGTERDYIRQFPLEGVLELLEMVGQGQHPRFVAAAEEFLADLCDPEPYSGGEPLIVFAEASV